MAKSDQLYKGKYFMVKSQLSELVLEVKGAVDRPGTAAVLGVPLRVEQGNDDHQLWYRHHETNTLRSKLNGLCLSVKGKHMYMRTIRLEKMMSSYHACGCDDRGQVTLRRPVVSRIEVRLNTSGPSDRKFVSQLCQLVPQPIRTCCVNPDIHRLHLNT